MKTGPSFDLDGMSNRVNAKRNKTVLFGSVIVIAVLAVASFVMLGFEQHEFLVFDAERTQARREVDRLREFAAKQEMANAAVSDELARRGALLVSRQQLFEEFNTLTGQVAILRQEVHLAREELNTAKETLAVEQGRLTTIKNDAVALDERRQTLNRDISTKATELSGAEVALATLKEQIVVLGLGKTSAQAAADEAGKQLAVEVERLTNVTVRIESVRNSLWENEKMVDNSKTTLTTLTLKIQAQEAKLAELTASIAEAERLAAKLKGEIAALSREKTVAQAASDALKSAMAEASGLHSNLLVKIGAQREASAQLEVEVDKARASRDALAAQAAAAQEVVKAKTAEKQELEADIAALTKKKAEAAREAAREVVP